MKHAIDTYFITSIALKIVKIVHFIWAATWEDVQTLAPLVVSSALGENSSGIQGLSWANQPAKHFSCTTAIRQARSKSKQRARLSEPGSGWTLCLVFHDNIKFPKQIHPTIELNCPSKHVL